MDSDMTNFTGVVLPDRPIDEVIQNIVVEEVRRLNNNLQFVETLEGSLRDKITERIAEDTLDLETLMDVIGLMNKSVVRSTSLIKDKDSQLIQILVDNHKEEINITQNNPVPELVENLSKVSRNKLLRLINTIASAEESGEINGQETQGDDTVREYLDDGSSALPSGTDSGS